MLDKKKIDTAIQRVNAEHNADFTNFDRSSRFTKTANQDALNYLINEAEEGVAGYIDAFFSVERGRPQWRYIVSRQQSGDVAEMQLYLGFWCSTAMMWQHLGDAILKKTDFVNVFASFYDLGSACLALLQAGHSSHAQTFANMVSRHYSHLITGTGAAPGLLNKDNVSPFFFVPNEWQDENSEFNPEYYLSRPGYEPYAQLVNIWDHPDPAKVSDTFQALRDRRLSLATMTEKQQGALAEYAEYYWLFFDPLLHAVNMRRIEMSLEPVIYESHIHGVEFPLEKVPFVADDILHPAYVKACDELDEHPMDFGQTIKVKQDPESGMLERS